MQLNMFQVNPNNIKELKEIYAQCENCNLYKNSNVVMGIGNIKSEIMIVSEQPDKSESESQEAFSGRGGNLLKHELRKHGFEWDELYLTNVVKCYSEDRKPNVSELKACKEILDWEISLIKPKIIVALGTLSIRSLLNVNEPISKIHGTMSRYKESDIIITYQPAYIRRLDKFPEKQEIIKKQFTDDWFKISQLCVKHDIQRTYDQYMEHEKQAIEELEYVLNLYD